MGRELSRVLGYVDLEVLSQSVVGKAMQIQGIIQGDTQIEKRNNNRALGNSSTYGQGDE